MNVNERAVDDRHEQSIDDTASDCIVAIEHCVSDLEHIRRRIEQDLNLNFFKSSMSKVSIHSALTQVQNRVTMVLQSMEKHRK